MAAASPSNHMRQLVRRLVFLTDRVLKNPGEIGKSRAYLIEEADALAWALDKLAPEAGPKRGPAITNAVRLWLATRPENELKTDADAR